MPSQCTKSCREADIGGADPLWDAHQEIERMTSALQTMAEDHDRTEAALTGDVFRLTSALDEAREMFIEIANRASNMMDADAADWLPSIYKIACEAAEIDPWPGLRAAGFTQDSLTVGFRTNEQKTLFCPDCGATLPSHKPGCHDGKPTR